MRRRTFIKALPFGASGVGFTAGERMPTISYDPTPVALFNPGDMATVFGHGRMFSSVQIAVEASRLAYIQVEQTSANATRLAQALETIGFGAVQPFADRATGSQAFGAYRETDRTALVAFRGTEPDALKDILGDVDALQVSWQDRAKVHRGFAQRALAMLPAIEQWLGSVAAARRSLLLTGHSLGAALATLAATVVGSARLVTIGSPQVGNDAFAASLASADCLRIVNCCDVIALLPLPIDGPLYAHVGKQLYVSKDGVVMPAADTAFIVQDRIAGALQHRVALPFAPLLRGLSDHAPINYIRAFFRSAAFARQGLLPVGRCALD